MPTGPVGPTGPPPSPSLPNPGPGASRASSGFTLVEVLIASTLSAILGSALIYLLSHFATLTDDLNAGRALQRDLQRATSLLRKDVSQATAVLEAGPGRLLLLSAAGDSLYYALSGASPDTLVRYVKGQSPAPVATGVDTFWTTAQTITIPRWRETNVPETTLVVSSQCDQDDLDELADSGSCDDVDLRRWRIEDEHWAAAQFWDTEDQASFDYAEVMVRNSDEEDGLDEDLILEIYKNDSSYGYPGTLVARGRIEKDEITPGWSWHGCELTMQIEEPVVAGATYWLVVRHDGSGNSSYAGSIRWGEVDDCDWSPQSNAKCLGLTTDGGQTWTETNELDRELLYRVYSPAFTTTFKEVVQNDTDTIGIAYALKLGQGNKEGRSEGFIALHNL